jgi:hypothetical protein
MTSAGTLDLRPLITDPWAVRVEDFPYTGLENEKLAFCLRYAILAASSHNSQPWHFRVDSRHVDLYADRTRTLPIVDPDGRELVISCGAALLHLRLAMRRFGLVPEVQTFPEPVSQDLLARVRIAGYAPPGGDETRLFDQIPQRRTNRQAFEPRDLPAVLMTALGNDAEVEGAWLRIAKGDDARHAVADLVAEADRRQWADFGFRTELAQWTHANRSPARDGIPGYAIGMNDVASLAAPIVMRTFDLGKGTAARDRELAEGSPVLAVVGTANDTPAAWLAAGQALSRLLLRARGAGVWASFLNQPIEVAALRPHLGEILGNGGFPQLLLRLGYGPDPAAPTPRRSLEEVLLAID